ncbi:MAG: D-alanine--D-alanine ligase [Actinomycetota bacterium]|nr:D-alanine--D-alanine ligase [Actinomycetota bacterium]
MTGGGDRTRLVVLFGGQSAEHEVSCVTAVSVLRALDPDRYDVVPVGITVEGRWVLAEEAQRVLAAGGAEALPPALEAKGRELEPFQALSEEVTQVVVLPLLHGPFGEDGTVQGLCELAGVPYVGSGVLGSAVAMDKLTTKRLVEAAGLPVPGYLGLREHEIGATVAARVEATLGWPVFVKPSNLGSSVGVSKASGPAELDAALAEALRYDEWVVVEEAIVGREIECAVLGDLEPEASVPGEVRPSHEFYDYEDKYVEGKAELLVPAPIPEDVTAEVRALALAAFAAVRAEGMARVDLFYEEAGPTPHGLLVNEVNTIPGFTPISMYPRLWEATGVPYPVLLDRLVQLAVDRHARRQGRVGRSLRGGRSDR